MHLFVESKKVLPALLASAEKVERLEKALKVAKLKIRAARGAIQTGQIIDKEPEVTLTRVLEVISTALKGNTDK